MLKNGKCATREAGTSDRRAATSHSIYTYNDKKISAFKKEVLESVSVDGWEIIGNKPQTRHILQESLSFLLCNTFNSERARNGSGFAGGAIDGCGFNRFDYESGAAYYAHFERYVHVTGSVIRGLVFLLWKYRGQLARFKISFPDDLFG